jgi:sugar phosphate isomerase/epimerase
MRIGPDAELTYCTNIHPANGWPAVLHGLREHVPALKARLGRDEPFGIGLRLSGDESRELLEGSRLDELKSFLDRAGLYVFTINGFPHGAFHGGRVKSAVHTPDWRSEERVAYTLRLAEILAHLLPTGAEGSISTSPLSYRSWVHADDAATWVRLTRNVVRVADALVRLRREQDKLIHLDLEPEPDGLLENTDELIDFFTVWLLDFGAGALADSLGVARTEARRLLLDHIRVCFDACHAAVAYEHPADSLDRLAEHGIAVGKVQLSSAVKATFDGPLGGRATQEWALRPLAEPVYLHQVIQRNGDGSFDHYPDLPDALAHIDDPRAREWRVHFHVPIFVGEYGALDSTQHELREVLRLLRERRFTRHLEIETYTWDVLPPALKTEVVGSIAREYEWVLDVLA